MSNAYPWLVVGPIAAQAIYCLAHLLICWSARRRSPYFSLALGAVVGFVAAVAWSAAALRAMDLSFGDAAALFLLNATIYLALAWGYFNFVNVHIASLRIRMLVELVEAPGGMSKERLLAHYNTEKVVEMRIERLLRGGHLEEKSGRFYSGKPVKFLLVARIYDIMRWIIIGQPNPALRLAQAASDEQSPPSGP